VTLPFKKRGKTGPANAGKPATRAEIEAEWRKIKTNTQLAQRGWRAADALCLLELDAMAINTLIAAKLSANEAILKRSHPQFDQWPVDAQMGIHSMAWSMGPSFGFPNFRAACNRWDFAAAAKECAINAPGDAAVAKRNAADAAMFRNADAVMYGEVSGQYGRQSLYYPRVLPPAPDWAGKTAAYAFGCMGLPMSQAAAQLARVADAGGKMFGLPTAPGPLKKKFFSTAYLSNAEFYQLALNVKSYAPSYTPKMVVDFIGAARLEIRQFPNRYVIR
jgi:hypothetical protein